MTRGEGFENSFWDPDITSTNGWDRLVRRMKDGKKVCQDVAHFLKERSKAESDYSKALLNLARKADGNEEIGGLGAGWMQMKSQTEDISKFHEDAAKTFLRLFEEMTQFNDEQKRVKQQHEDTMKRLNKIKYETYTKAMSLKKSYENKCRDFDNAEKNYKTIQKTVSATRKDVEKYAKTLDRSKESMTKEDTAYKNCIEALDKSRINWEKTMEVACKVFHKLEIERMEFLRNKIWEATNTDSLACVLHDDACELVRQVLENSDIQEDIQKFIESNRSGNNRPERVEYENYYNKTPHNRKPAPKPKLAPMRPPAISPVKTQTSFDFPADEEESGYSTVRDLRSSISSRPQKPIPESHYASVDDVNDPPPLSSSTKTKIPMVVPRSNTTSERL